MKTATIALPQVKSLAGLVRTPIEWADFAFNPLRAVVKHDIWVKGGRVVAEGTPGARLVKAGTAGWGCQKCAPGCKNCYAEAMNKRFGTGLNYDAEAMKHVEVVLDSQRVEAALRAKVRGPFKSPRGRAGVFVCDMADLFGDFVTDTTLSNLFLLFTHRQDVDWLLLTKRPARAAAFLAAAGVERLTPNVWLGCSVSCQADADENIPHLLRAPAAVRFVSYEPATGPVDFWKWLPGGWLCHRCSNVGPTPECAPDGDGEEVVCHACGAVGERDGLEHRPIHWLIVGGESGAGARPCNAAWLRSAVKQAKTAGVPVFVKQLGSKPTEAPHDWRSLSHLGQGEACRDDGGPLQTTPYLFLDDSKGGDPSEWPEDMRVREWPAARAMEAACAQ